MNTTYIGIQSPSTGDKSTTSQPWQHTVLRSTACHTFLTAQFTIEAVPQLSESQLVWLPAKYPVLDKLGRIVYKELTSRSKEGQGILPEQRTPSYSPHPSPLTPHPSLSSQWSSWDPPLDLWSESHLEQSHNLWPYTEWRSALPLRTLIAIRSPLYKWSEISKEKRLLQAEHLYSTDIRYTLIKHWPLGSLQQSHQASPFWGQSDTRQWVHSVDSFGHRQENTENTAYLHLYNVSASSTGHTLLLHQCTSQPH